MSSSASSEAGSFAGRVRDVLRALPPGDVLSYGEVAAEAGHPGAARAVGRLVSTLDDVPWWRVVNARGRVCPRKVDEATQRLRAEGVSVEAGYVRRAGGRSRPPAG